MRDKFWFHPMVFLRFETSAPQMRSVTTEVHKLLMADTRIETSSVRVRFLGIGASSLNVEVFAYVFAVDWNEFLEIQEALLLKIMEIIEHAGAKIAFPSQTTYLAADSSDKVAQIALRPRTRREAAPLEAESGIRH